MPIRRLRWFITSWAIVIVVMVAPSLLTETEPVAIRPGMLFVLVVIAAALCVVSSCWMLWIASRQNLAETGLVGVWFLVLSVLPLVHGLTTPGILYEANGAFTASVFIAGPLAAAAALPTLFRTTRWANRIATSWQLWVSAWAVAVTGLSVVLLISPDLVGTPQPGSRVAILACLPALGLAMLYSWRYLTLAAVSGATRYLALFFAFVFTGVSQLVWVASAAYGPTFWFAHVFDIVGVFAGTVGGAVVLIKTRPPSDLVGPVLDADPLIALDLALDPAIDAFIAELDAKDPVTRDHVLRTAESAVQLAAALRLKPIDVRNTGIGAVLHDIGKIAIPDAILQKAGRLDADEFEIMKSHAAIGGELVARNPALRGVADIVRGHHERIDGHGYPDGLGADAIPITARILSVCDAYDAMAHDRPYRTGMGKERAIAILQEHAGSQWDPNVVAAFARLVAADRVRHAPTTLDRLGRSARPSAAPGDQDDDACGCLAALPDIVARELLRET